MAPIWLAWFGPGIKLRNRAPHLNFLTTMSGDPTKQHYCAQGQNNYMLNEFKAGSRDIGS